MRCPQCAANNRKTLRACGQCGYKFALSPTKHGQWNDNRFKALLGRMGDSYFTENQLYAAFCHMDRKKKAASPAVAYGMLLLGPIVLAIAYLVNVFWLFLPGAFLTFIGFISCISRILAKPPGRKLFAHILHDWTAARGPIERLLIKPRLSTPPPDFSEPDIYAYGFERLLIVQHPILVDFFVLNEFHIEQKALVLSAKGYPTYLVPLAEKMLEAKPDMPIFLLHDADDEGRAMSARSLPFDVSGHPVTDLGLHPEDVRKLKALQFLQPKKAGYQLPVDMLAPGMLSTAAFGAMVLGTPMVEQLLLREAEAASFGGADMGGSYG